MRIHILGICGTFMANVALLARDLGHEVSGSDSGVYPPMSDLLADSGVVVFDGYSDSLWSGLGVDLVLVGNALSRGNPSLEYVLDSGLRFSSGAAWLAENVLCSRRVVAVAGTHGKTSTTAMLAWILQRQGLAPGYLIGGMAGNFPVPAALGAGGYFVIEADEYDTAFSDKRSKFVHYRPDVLVCNHLEFDHADIFTSVEDIYRQFHCMVRTMSSGSSIIYDAANVGMREVLAMGCWSGVSVVGAGSSWELSSADAAWREFSVGADTVSWSLLGRHNAQNAMMAVVAAGKVGIEPAAACAALAEYRPVSRRMEPIYDDNGILVYSDFAHHPTSIAASIDCLRQAYPERRLIVVLEPASYTMRNQCHGNWAESALHGADRLYVYRNERVSDDLGSLAGMGTVYTDAGVLCADLVATVRADDVLLMMSNASFAGLLQSVPQALAGRS